jgi:hypothetical protein
MMGEQCAKVDWIGMNQFPAMAAAEKLAVMQTADFLFAERRERAMRMRRSVVSSALRPGQLFGLRPLRPVSDCLLGHHWREGKT